uniref:Uncharacterized protein n=1 Tax=Arundo donax TaxID=35708 RepID=A0A0A9FQY2_ARUDO
MLGAERKCLVEQALEKMLYGTDKLSISEDTADMFSIIYKDIVVLVLHNDGLKTNTQINIKTIADESSV